MNVDVPTIINSASTTFDEVMGFEWGNVIAWTGDNIKLVVGSGFGLFSATLPWIMAFLVVAGCLMLVFSAFRFMRH